MAVKFLKSTQVGTLYNEGEIAGFDADIEKKLVDSKVAEKVAEKKHEAPKA